MGIRTTDPFYRFLILSSIKEWYGIIDEEPEKGINAEVLSTFLSSSLNIELVYIILAGITKFSSEREEDKNQESNRKSSKEELYDIQAFENIRMMQINKIRINNARDWDVARYDQFVSNTADEYNQGTRELKESIL